MSELEVKLTLAAEVQRLELRPGDKLALTVDSLLTYEQAMCFVAVTRHKGTSSTQSKFSKCQ